MNLKEYKKSRTQTHLLFRLIFQSFDVTNPYLAGQLDFSDLDYGTKRLQT
jgi:hypothetical protein